MSKKAISLLAVGLCLTAGCANNPKRAAIDGAGALGGAAIASSVSHRNPTATAAGAAAGAILADVAQGRDDSTYQQGVDDGYRQAESDEAKRKFWQQQQRNASAGGGEGGGRTVYYVFDESDTTTKDGRKRPAKTEVAVPVYEPEPVR